MEGILRVSIIAIVSLYISTPGFASLVLRVPLASSKISLDPTQIQDQSSLWVSRHINCQLIRFDGQTITMDAAESVRFRNPLQLEVVIKKNIKFRDQSPLTATDVITSFELLRRSRIVYRNIFQWVKSFQILDRYRIIITLSKPVPHFLKVLSAQNYAIFKKEFLTAAARDTQLWSNPIGCGRYQIGRYDTINRVISLVPFEKNKPEIQFTLMGSNEVPASRAPDFDIIGLPISGEINLEKSHTGIDLFDPYQIFFTLNSTLAQWKDRSERCALFRSINKNKLLNAYPRGTENAKDLIPRGILGYLEWPELSAPDRQTSYHKKSEFCLMILSVSIPESLTDVYGKLFGDQFEKVNIRILNDPKQMGYDFLRSKCDGFIFGLKSNYLDGYEFLQVFGSGHSNTIGHSSRELNQKIEESQNITDSGQRAAYYQEITRYILNRCYAEPLITIPKKKVYVRKRLELPNFGMIPLISYDLGNVQ